MDTITDTLSLMNLLAFERFPEFARRRGLQIVTLPEVTHEIDALVGGEVIGAVQTALRTSITCGQIRTADVCLEDHPELYCQLFPSISDLPTRAVLLAQQRNGQFMTDSAKTLAVVAGVLPGCPLMTSLGLLRRWFEEEDVSSVELTAFVQRSASFFLPVGRHPLRKWWLEQL